jgi:HEAT repeat protein
LPAIANHWFAILCATALLVGCERSTTPSPSQANVPPPSVNDVVGQLEGRHCRFAVEPLDACAPRPVRGPLDWAFTRHEDRWTCPTGAARCLGKMGPSARPAVPALIKALASGIKDHDTGDGVIPVRSSIIEALGRTGDPRAVDPVADLLPDEADAYAALTALAALGPPATRRAHDVSKFLETRIADEQARQARCTRAVQQFEYLLANDAVVERLQREHPTRTRFLVSPQEHASALAALDRTTQRYRENREGRCRDLVGEAAVQALAAMQCEACLATVVAALATPDIALQAAWALRAQPVLPKGAEGALRDVLTSPIHGPLAKLAARQALDFVGR